MRNGELIDVFEHLIPVSAFSKGQTSKIMDDVSERNEKYVILKNNQPKAMLISVEQFKDIALKAAKFEALLEKIEEHRLLKMAEDELKNYNPDTAPSFDEMLKRRNIDIQEIDNLMETVEIE